MKKLLTYSLAFALLLGLVGPAVAQPDSAEFGAYYTRLDFTIPLEKAIGTIPYEAYEGSDVSDPLRPPENGITGKYADVVVNVGAAGQLVFSRETSYLPCWKTAQGRWELDEIVPHTPDIACLYSYVRIIESDSNRALIHWRYMPDPKNPVRRSAVHELFELTSDGKVMRSIRQGADKLDEYRDPANMTVQTLQLQADGIKEVSLKKATLTKQPQGGVSGSLVNNKTVASPVAWWKFDEGLTKRAYDRKDITLESISGTECAVDGNITLWKAGTSGTALAFDGYKSKVSLPASKAPAIKDTLTAEAWIVPGAYPWNWAPAVHQSVLETGQTDPDIADPRPGRGYYLGLDAYGYPLFVVDGNEVTGSEKLPTNKWSHIAGTYGDGTIRVFLDGEEVGSKPAFGGAINVPDTALVIGLNTVQASASDPVRPGICNLEDIYGIEGLIDEVRIYDEALSASQIAESFAVGKPADEIRDNPDLQPRVLPGQPRQTYEFGAKYTDLAYHELWDNLFRTSGYSDILVKFEDFPGSLVFWRGTNGGAGWVTENNLWMSDQSLEVGGKHGCAEHMSDKDCRHSHVRLIENTPARVVVHWRYPSIDVGYLFPGIGHWTDEYYYIYPDGVAVRKVNFRNGESGWHDIQFLNAARTGPLDNVSETAMSVANTAGESADLTWSTESGIPENPLRDAVISMVNFKSDYKVFLVYPEGAEIGTWGANEMSPHVDQPFAGPWNHWPVGQMPSDGRFAVDTDRLSCGALGGDLDCYRRGNMVMYGLTDKPVAELAPLARSWNNPPEVAGVDDCTSHGYSKEQRAYLFTTDSYRLTFVLDGSEESPIVNPCLVIKNCPIGDVSMQLEVNGNLLQVNSDFYEGFITDTDGTRTMVAWLNYEAASPTFFRIKIR